MRSGVTRSVVDIREAVKDKRQQMRSLDSISGILVHRVGVNGRTGAVIGYDAESICAAFTGRRPTWAQVASATNSQNPYTFYIGGHGQHDGMIWQALDLQEIGWHARSYSRKSVGVAMIGDFRSSVDCYPTSAQMESLIWLLSGLSTVLLDVEIGGHGEIPEAHGGEKAPGAPDACPGDLVDMDGIRSTVRAMTQSACPVAARQALVAAGVSL